MTAGKAIEYILQSFWGQTRKAVIHHKGREEVLKIQGPQQRWVLQYTSQFLIKSCLTVKWYMQQQDPREVWDKVRMGNTLFREDFSRECRIVVFLEPSQLLCRKHCFTDIMGITTVLKENWMRIHTHESRELEWVMYWKSDERSPFYVKT